MGGSLSEKFAPRMLCSFLVLEDPVAAAMMSATVTSPSSSITSISEKFARRRDTGQPVRAPAAMPATNVPCPSLPYRGEFGVEVRQVDLAEHPGAEVEYGAGTRRCRSQRPRSSGLRSAARPSKIQSIGAPTTMATSDRSSTGAPRSSSAPDRSAQSPRRTASWPGNRSGSSSASPCRPSMALNVRRIWEPPIVFWPCFVVSPRRDPSNV